MKCPMEKLLFENISEGPQTCVIKARPIQIHDVKQNNRILKACQELKSRVKPQL